MDSRPIVMQQVPPHEGRTAPTAAPTPGAPDGRRVRAMFDRIAARYDLLNHVLSLQLDRGWRRRAARLACRGMDAPRVLDLCTGTGDLLLAVRRVCRGAQLFGADFSLGMLSCARRKQPALHLAAADALALPYAGGAFDALTVAFGVRNLEDRARAFREMRRVLRPGGRLVILEFTPPPRGAFGAVYRWYSAHVLPRIGALLSPSPDAYRYLPESVARFPDREQLRLELERAGFVAVEHEPLAGGTVAIHHGVRGGPDAPAED